MPVCGDVDCLVASELAEAGRAIQRGLVSAQRTTLISSTHRTYAIGEKSAMGEGALGTAELLELVRSQGKCAILFDMEAVAERHQSVVSAVMLGAISGAGVLPFPRASFEDAIREGGLAVKTNLAAFADACALAHTGGTAPADAVPRRAALPPVPARAQTPALQPLLERIHTLPRSVQQIALEGTRRCLDYQDPAYAALYLERVGRMAALEGADGHAAGNYSDSEKIFAFRLRPAPGAVKQPARCTQSWALSDSQGTAARSEEISRLACCSIERRSRTRPVLVMRRE